MTHKVLKSFKINPSIAAGVTDAKVDDEIDISDENIVKGLVSEGYIEPGKSRKNKKLSKEETENKLLKEELQDKLSKAEADNKMLKEELQDKLSKAEADNKMLKEELENKRLKGEGENKILTEENK